MQQDSLLDDEKIESSKGPVECLGQTFANEEARREHYTKLLREKLKDPEFRKIEGFPIGTDEAILGLSDPPYYTACPNPWLNDFVEYWESQKENSDEEYHREPFAADVSEGRSGLFYDAHSYHTKVPHKAIMRYILHFTKPGDILMDSFCGTGMTGVAAQLCGNKKVIEELGYQVDANGNIYQNEESGKVKISELGVRYAINNDLSPAASFIAHNYNFPLDVNEFHLEATKLLDQTEKELNWLYTTEHENGEKALINYIIWSDVFECNECGSEVNFYNTAIDFENNKLLESFSCPGCAAKLTKKTLGRLYYQNMDTDLNKVVKRAKQVPVLINYTYQGKRFEKSPTTFDFETINKINNYLINSYIPINELIDGYNTKQPKTSHGIEVIKDFYTKRNLIVLSTLRANIQNKPKRLKSALSFLINSYDLTHSTIMSRLIFKGKGKKPVLTGYQSGTLYASSLPVEKNIFNGIRKQKLPIITSSLNEVTNKQLVNTGSASQLSLASNSLDYIFIDPPFGSNIMYSELNYISESWMKLFTNNQKEAIENKVQNKTLDDYRGLMFSCFKEAYRVLKPGRWITIEFSNTKASVWNSIQSALTEAGFIVANVSALDKKQGSFKAVTTTTAVKQDLVISAYKSTNERIHTNQSQLGQETVWNFIGSHLKYLPLSKTQNEELIKIPERDPRILFDQVVSYFIRENRQVPMSSQEFQVGLAERFVERDGMYFTPEQVVFYDQERAKRAQVKQLSIFVDDEASAIEWLRQILEEPKTYSEIHPLFINELSGWKKHEIQLELSTLLEQNFIKYDGLDDIPKQLSKELMADEIGNNSLGDKSIYKNKWYIPNLDEEKDLVKLRLKNLLRDFEQYITEKKKLKQPRIEALRAGFKNCWEQQNYQTILDVASKIPSNVLQEDEKLVMFYDNATTLLSDDIDEWD
ncbi:DNA methyltransferase [Pseudoalteromonas sp. S1612]|uniref:DNA methyltransferase n=1 Tax=Pseudoalteromonas sp. S1612 TaxID=579507 RepID=UPI00110BF58A|nr:DNA methyltransferase [Pseudoalteromonas sp. S1612]TMP55064.1 DNA methylase [Pseudoalteromonas sp. S1612]